MGSVTVVMRYVCGCENREGLQAKVEVAAGDEAAFTRQALDAYRRLSAEIREHENAKRQAEAEAAPEA